MSSGSSVGLPEFRWRVKDATNNPGTDRGNRRGQKQDRWWKATDVGDTSESLAQRGQQFHDCSSWIVPACGHSDFDQFICHWAASLGSSDRTMISERLELLN